MDLWLRFLFAAGMAWRAEPMAEDASGNLQAAHDLFGLGVVRTQVVDMDIRSLPITSTDTHITVGCFSSAQISSLSESPNASDFLTPSPHNKDSRQSVNLGHRDSNDAERGDPWSETRMRRKSGSTGATICQDALRSLTNVARMAKTAASWSKVLQQTGVRVRVRGRRGRSEIVGLLLLDDETAAHPVARLLDECQWLRLRRA